MNLPQEFLDRMRAQLGSEYPDYLAAMELAPRRALRVNTLKTDAPALLARFGGALEPTGVGPDSFFTPDGFQPARSLLHRAGHFYMQEPSAQLPVTALPLSAGMAVLDLCAAPGGKASQIAAALGNTGLVVANEPVASRARMLSGNLERLGVTNAAVTCMRPEQICPLLPGCFDAVLVDAPCSGEGMFRKDAQAVRDWSLAHVRACAARQKPILDAAATALRPGGTLVYATCTFSPEENETVISAFLDTHADFSCEQTQRVYPHASAGEGQFFARLRRSGSAQNGMLPAEGQRTPAWEEFCADFLTALPFQRPRLLPDGRVFLLPELKAPNYEKMHIVGAGVLAGEIRNGRFIPAHALAMAFPNTFINHAELDAPAAAAYLRGETVACGPMLAGWCAVSCNGLVLGLGKAVSGTLKNHLPKGLRS